MGGHRGPRRIGLLGTQFWVFPPSILACHPLPPPLPSKPKFPDLALALKTPNASQVKHIVCGSKNSVKEVEKDNDDDEDQDDYGGGGGGG